LSGANYLLNSGRTGGRKKRGRGEKRKKQARIGAGPNKQNPFCDSEKRRVLRGQVGAELKGDQKLENKRGEGSMKDRGKFL